MSRAAFIVNVASKGDMNKAEAKRTVDQRTVDLVLARSRPGSEVEEGGPLHDRQLRHFHHHQAQGAQGPQPADR